MCEFKLKIQPKIQSKPIRMTLGLLVTLGAIKCFMFHWWAAEIATPSVFLAFLLVWLVLSWGKFPDILTGQWISRRLGTHSRSAFFRAIWLYVIIICLLWIYFYFDTDKGDNLAKVLQGACKVLPEDAKTIDAKTIIFSIDNCARKSEGMAGFFVAGFFGLLAGFQADFVSKYRLLHELRQKYWLREKDCPDKIIDDRFSGGLIDNLKNDRLSTNDADALYFIERCLDFELHKNNAFEPDFKLCMDKLKVKDVDVKGVENLYKKGFKRIAFEVKYPETGCDRCCDGKFFGQRFVYDMRLVDFVLQ